MLKKTLPYGCSHWMLKEIMEQPECINKFINYGGK